MPNTYLTFAYPRRGDYDRAQQQLQRIRLFAPGSTGYAGQIHALSADAESARAEIPQLRAMARDRYVSAYDLATIHARSDPRYLALMRRVETTGSKRAIG